jgi:hypothetical protein
MGKDERAISVSGHVHRGLVKYTDRAFEKTIIYKRHSRNHLLDQVESFRIGEKVTARTTFSTHSATASRWRSGIAKAIRTIGCPENKEFPRSPCNAAKAQVPTRIAKG